MNFKKIETFADGREIYSSTIDNRLVSYDGVNFKLTMTCEEIEELYFELKDIKCGLKWVIKQSKQVRFTQRLSLG